jgi:cyclopropane fatty-acyl-phospholipid synthase-like methyltransferase
MNATTARHMGIFADYLRQRDWHIDRVEWRMKDQFRDVSWVGKDVFEVGCGSGEISIYMALTGARRVIGIDPGGAGSNDTARQRMQDLIQKLELDNFEFYPVLFQDFDQKPESFDIIFGVNSVEHIFETTLPLAKDRRAWDLYARYFADIRAMLRPGGVMLQYNNSRYAWAAYLSWLTHYKYRHPVSKSICWELHQTPQTWCRVAREAGFRRTYFHWRVMYPLRKIPWIARLGIVPFFLSAEYNVFAYK